MERKELLLFGEIQARLQDYCGKVLATLVKNFPEVGISECWTGRSYKTD